MSRILLSIKPEYVAKIFTGAKKYEYRKRIASKCVSTILIYETYPTCMVVGEVKVIGTLSSSPSAIWEDTKKYAGISREKYRKYYKGCKHSFAYCLGDFLKYEQPIPLYELGVNKSPQSFIYLD